MDTECEDRTESLVVRGIKEQDITLDTPGQGAVLVVEPLLPQRIRRPSDALRFLLTLLGLAAVILMALALQRTLNGLETDVQAGTGRAPEVLSAAAGLLGGVAVLIVPVAFAVERVFHRDGMRVTQGLIAAILALLVSYVLGESLIHSGPADLVQLLTGGREVEPLNTVLTPAIAYATAVRMGRRPHWRALMWVALALDVFALFTATKVTALGVIMTYVVGLAVGFGTLYGIGSANTRPPGSAVLAALRRLGFAPVSARRVEDDSSGSRRYLVGLVGDQRIDVTVLDRDRQVAGVLYRLWRRFLLNNETRRRAIRSLRAELEREALMAYAAQAAGVRLPRLLGTSEVGTEAALLAYEHVDTRPVSDLQDEDFDDELLERMWEQVRLLHAHRLAHRHLTGESIHVDAQRNVYLVDARSGEIAAGDLLLRLDIAQLLAYLGTRVGAERSVGAAAKVLGENTLAGAMPLLQRIALSRDTRTAARRDRKLLPAIREQIVALKPQVEVEEVRLERFRPRTLVTIIVSALGAYLLLTQLSRVNLITVLTTANWAWSGVALVAGALSYVAAAILLRGFVPEPLPLGRTVLAQLAASFVKLVAPAAVGGVALNTRYLQKRGVPPAAAVTSVGASQLIGLAMHIMLLLLFGYLTGTQAAPSLTPSRGLLVVLLGVAVLFLIVLAVGPLRRLLTTRLRAMFSGVIPRLLDVVQSPKKMVEAVGGTLLLTLSFVICLQACVQAFGGEASFTAVAVVFLAGNAIGSAAPTPGGLGAVEYALSLGLQVAGVPGPIATSAVLLFRLMTFWLPVLPGWASFAYLQRQNAL